jgi:hypothetical protein
MERSPTPEQLAEIVDAARYVVRTAVETFCVAGQPELPGYPDTSRSVEVLRGIARLERVLNPCRIPFGAPGRRSLGVSGWSDVLRLGRAVAWLRELLDLILASWGLQALCGARAYMLVTEGSEFTGELRPGIALVRTPKEWPPKIDRAVLDGMQTAATWIAEIIAFSATHEGSDAAPAAAGRRDVDPNMTNKTEIIMGDKYENVQGSTVVSRSEVKGSFNQTRNDHSTKAATGGAWKWLTTGLWTSIKKLFGW